MLTYGWFTLRKNIGESKIVIHARMRNTEIEDRINNNLNSVQQEEPEFLSDKVDQDDIMKRISQDLDEDKFMKMFSTFTVCINKGDQSEAVAFHCRSVESDLFIEYLQPVEGSIIDDPFKVFEAGRKYHGPEAFMMEDTYRLGLNEYLRTYTIDEQVCVAIEHLSIVLDSEARKATAKMLADFFAIKK